MTERQRGGGSWPCRVHTPSSCAEAGLRAIGRSPQSCPEAQGRAGLLFSVLPQCSSFFWLETYSGTWRPHLAGFLAVLCPRHPPLPWTLAAGPSELAGVNALHPIRPLSPCSAFSSPSQGPEHVVRLSKPVTIKGSSLSGGVALCWVGHCQVPGTSTHK